MKGSESIPRGWIGVEDGQKDHAPQGVRGPGDLLLAFGLILVLTFY